MQGRKVKMVMLQRNLSQRELATRLGLSLPYLNMVINGHRRTRWIREAIARELGRRVESLFSKSEERRAIVRR